MKWLRLLSAFCRSGYVLPKDERIEKTFSAFYSVADEPAQCVDAGRPAAPMQRSEFVIGMM